MKKVLVGFMLVIGGGYVASLTPLAEEEWFGVFADVFLTVETLFTVGIGAVLGTIYTAIKWFESGKGWAFIISLIGSRVFRLLDDENERDKAEVVFASVLKLPVVEAFVDRLNRATAGYLQQLKTDLVDVKAKLELGDALSKELQAELLQRKAELIEAIAHEENTV